MKKQIVTLLLFLGNLCVGFSNSNVKTAFDDLVGNYTGFELTEKGIQADNKIIAALSADFNLKLTESFDGLLVEHINEKIAPQNGVLKEEKEEYMFTFSPKNEEGKYTAIRFYINKKPPVEGSDFLMTIVLIKEKGVQVFMVSKKGGNPKMPTQDISFNDIYRSVKHQGETHSDTFGGFEIEWYPSEGIGYLSYKNVINTFKIVKKEDKYRLTNDNDKNDIEADYIFRSDGKYRLIKVNRGKKLFSQSYINLSKNFKSADSEKDFLKKLGYEFYSMIKTKYKKKGTYSLTSTAQKSGKGLVIVIEDSKLIVYAGHFTDGTYDGEGTIYFPSSTEKGSFKNGVRHGHFHINVFGKYEASGGYAENKKEGLWKVKAVDNSTFDLVYKNGKEVSRTATNTGVENTQVANHIKDAKHQLGNIANVHDQISTIINSCGEKRINRSDFSLKDYKYCLKPVIKRIDFLNVGIVAADQEFTKALKAAKKSKCSSVVEALEHTQDFLWKGKARMSRARNAFNDLFYGATTNDAMESDHNKGVENLKEAIDFFNKYKIWEALLDERKCYEYSITDSSTLPSSKTASNQKSSQNKKSNAATNKKKTTSAVSSTVVYPNFSGKYEGDNLLLLMGRKVDDLAIQSFLKSKEFEFTESTRMVPKGQRKFYSANQRLSISFKEGILYKMEFSVSSYDESEYFQKELPQHIPLGKALSQMKNRNDNWKVVKYGSNHTYNLEKHQLLFKVKGDTEKGIVQMVEILALDVKDWNSYYRQFK